MFVQTVKVFLPKNHKKKMNTKKFSMLIDLFKINKGLSDKDIISNLISRGIDKVESEKYVVFVPLAFGRVHLNSRYNNLQFNDFYYKSKSSRKVSLLQDKIYSWAKDLSEKNKNQSFMDEEAYLSIITRSSEIKSVLEAMAQKQDIDGAVFNTIVNVGLTFGNDA